MKKILLLLAVLGLFFLSSCSKKTSAQQLSLSEIASSEAKFKTPESVFFDSENNVFYVSNINGDPTKHDGNGFVSKMDANGKIIRLQWITGLDAPKGMAKINNKLYVTDIDKLVEIDLEKGEISNRYEVSGAKFLNDIAADKRGNLYISDMTGNKIYKFSGGKISLWLDKNLNSPNGMLFVDNILYIGNTGYLLKIDLTTNKQEKIFKNITGMVDGLKEYKGGFITTDWIGNITYLKGEKKIVLKKAQKGINAADLELVGDKLYVPTFGDNRVVIYKISEK